MRIVVAPQEFKGTLTAEEAARAIAEGIIRAVPEATVDTLPMADGGPGTVQAVIAGTGGREQTSRVHDALGRPVDASWGLLPDGTAVIEMAAAAGLTQLAEESRDPRITTTHGVGELIRATLDGGSRRLIVGLGGSATNDGGAGMAQALGVRLLDDEGCELPPGGEALARLARVDVSVIDGRLAETTVLAATDVRNPLCGPEGASIVYGPQKGATPAVAAELDRALARYAAIVERDLGVAVANIAGAGAAGGLGAGLIAFAGAEIRPGVELVSEIVGLAGRIRGADLVVTGEGRLDGQSQHGKTPVGVAMAARAEKVPVLAIAGSSGPEWQTVAPLFDATSFVVGLARTQAQSLADPAGTLTDAAEKAIADWLTKNH